MFAQTPSGNSCLTHLQSALLQSDTDFSCVSLVLLLPADRDGEIKHGEHVRPLPFDVEVSDDGGSDGGVTGLPDSDQASS